MPRGRYRPGAGRPKALKAKALEKAPGDIKRAAHKSKLNLL
jgi:hypothetical protein